MSIERTLDGMKVERIGRGQYYCSSEKDPNKRYTVDILRYGGLGECDCWDWIARRYPRFMKLKIPFNCYRCKHIRRVRNHVLDQILAPYIEKEKGNHERTQS